MRSVIVVALLGLAALHAGAQFPPPPAQKPDLPRRDLDSTLDYYLTASSHALVGEVISDPVKQDKLFSFQKEKDPRGIYTCRVKVVEPLHNTPSFPKDHELTVAVVRWPDPRDEAPAGVKKGEKYVFFLHWNYGTPGPHTADPWFGVQPYSAKMVELLRKMGNRPAK